MCGRQLMDRIPESEILRIAHLIEYLLCQVLLMSRMGPEQTRRSRLRAFASDDARYFSAAFCAGSICMEPEKCLDTLRNSRSTYSGSVMLCRDTYSFHRICGDKDWSGHDTLLSIRLV